MSKLYSFACFQFYILHELALPVSCLVEKHLLYTHLSAKFETCSLLRFFVVTHEIIFYPYTQSSPLPMQQGLLNEKPLCRHSYTVCMHAYMCILHTHLGLSISPKLFDMEMTLLYSIVMAESQAL